MAIPDELRSILEKNGNIITTAQANEAGISNQRLRLLVNSGDLERVSFGVYILPDEFTDKMYIAQLRRPKIIYSHETALFLHDLNDRDPISYTVTVPKVTMPQGFEMTASPSSQSSEISTKSMLQNSRRCLGIRSRFMVRAYNL